MSSSSQAKVRQGRVALYMKSGRGEMYSIYLMYFVNSIRFGWTIVLIQITRKASRKSNIDEIAFIQKMITKKVKKDNKMLASSS